MTFVFDARPSDSSYVDAIWRTHSVGGGSFTSLAESRWGIVVTKQQDKTYVTVRGPETKAMSAPIPENAEFMGINFKLGTFLPNLPAQTLVDDEIHMPEAGRRQSFWFLGSSWELPNFENADTFVQRLIHDGLLVHDPVVDAVLQGQPPDLSVRSVRRRFLQATGLTYKAIQQIERARQAVALLEQGMSILDTAFELGYFDQPHLTKSLKYLMGQTPAQILRVNTPE